MRRIIRFAEIVRNNWKKSIFGAGICIYGVNYGLSQYEVRTLMRAYCEEAVQYGDKPIGPKEGLRKITVILNPAANKKKAKKHFEKYCAPLLFLSGAYVSVLETEKEGHARELVDKVASGSDAIVIAGGDGTISEAVTGLMRSRGELCKIPIGIIPLGQRNSFASALFGEDCSSASKLAGATMAVIKGLTKTVDAFRIEIIKDSGKDELGSGPQPVYGVASIEWGIRRELRRRADTFWYLGPLGPLATLVFHGPQIHTAQNLGFIEAKLRYSPPCDGCSKCYKYRPDLSKPVQEKPAKWWNFSSLKNRRLQNNTSEPVKDYSGIQNESCGIVTEKVINTSDFYLTTGKESEKSHVSKIVLNVGPQIKHQGQLLSDGYKLLKNEENYTTIEKLEAKQIEIMPLNNESLESPIQEVIEDCFAIDNEDFEVRPIKVTLLPKSVNVFCN